MKTPRTLWEVPAHDLLRAQAQALADIARELPPDDPSTLTRGVTPAGDERRLRGIPAIGRGVTGAIPGTIPHAA